MVYPDSLWVVATDANISEIGARIDSFQCQLNAVQTKGDALFGIVEATNSCVSNQLASADRLLGLVAVLVSVAVAFVGWYVQKKKKEIEEMAKTIDEKKTELERIAVSTSTLSQQINKDIKDLYKKLRKEETNALLDRLVLEPLDIDNLAQLLLARDLEDDGFFKLRESYLKYVAAKEETSDDTDIAFVALFFQHYCSQSIQDDEIRPALVKRFAMACRSAFKRDMIKSTIDLCKALSDETSSFNKEDVLVAYLKALDASPHRDLENLKNILEQNISSPTLLANAIARCKDDGVYLKLFGVEKSVEGEGAKADG